MHPRRATTRSTCVLDVAPAATLSVRPLPFDDADAERLLRMSDEYMAARYPPESNHADSIDVLRQADAVFVGAYLDAELVGCGAVKVLDDDGIYGEIKRVFVAAEHRGKGIAGEIMRALEDHLRSRGIGIARLEAGPRQPEALRLYGKLGYTERAAFGAYVADPLSIFMERRLEIDSTDA